MKEMKEPPGCVGSSKKTGKRPKIVVVWYYGYYYTVLITSFLLHKTRGKLSA